MCATLTIGNKILVAANYMLAKGIAYQDLGETYLDQVRQIRTVANPKRRIERPGYQVTLEPKHRQHDVTPSSDHFHGSQPWPRAATTMGENDGASDQH